MKVNGIDRNGDLFGNGRARLRAITLQVLAPNRGAQSNAAWMLP
jgi:hypothetical protein